MTYQPNEHWYYGSWVDGADLDYPLQLTIGNYRPLSAALDSSPQNAVARRYFRGTTTNPVPPGSAIAPWATTYPQQFGTNPFLTGAASWDGSAWYVSVAWQGQSKLHRASSYFDGDFPLLASNIASSPSGETARYVQRIKKVRQTTNLIAPYANRDRIITHEVPASINATDVRNERIYSIDLAGGSRQLITTFLNPATPTSGSAVVQHESLEGWCFRPSSSASTQVNEPNLYYVVRKWTTTGNQITLRQQQLRWHRWLPASSTYSAPSTIYQTAAINPADYDGSSSVAWEQLQCPFYSDALGRIVLPSATFVRSTDTFYPSDRRTKNRILLFTDTGLASQFDLPNPTATLALDPNFPSKTEVYNFGCTPFAWTSGLTNRLYVWTIKAPTGTVNHPDHLDAHGVYQHHLNGSNRIKIANSVGDDAGQSQHRLVSQNFFPGPGCHAPWECSV